MSADTYFCERCRRKITNDEIGMTKKLINRGTHRYFCFACLADAFDIDEADVRKKARYFKENGCTLFLHK